MNGTIINDKNDASDDPFTPVSTGYVLPGQNIPTGQNVLIRARGFYRSGERNGSEILEDNVQNVFLRAPVAGKVSISGRVVTTDGAGLRNASVQLTFENGDFVTKTTNAFGYFQFDEITDGQTVTVSVTAKNLQLFAAGRQRRRQRYGFDIHIQLTIGHNRKRLRFLM